MGTEIPITAQKSSEKHGLQKAGVDIEAGYESVKLDEKICAGDHETGSLAIWRIFRHLIFIHQGYGGTGFFFRYRWMWYQGKTGISYGQA